MQRAAAVVESADLPVYKHSDCDLGIATTACTHALSTIPINLHTNQTYYQFLAGDVIREEYAFEDGCLPVYNSTGLSVTLDREKLTRFHEV